MPDEASTHLYALVDQMVIGKEGRQGHKSSIYGVISNMGYMA